MLASVFLTLSLLSLQGIHAKRCQISNNFQRYCGGKNRATFDITPEQCRAKCDADRNCVVGHWHPGNQIWKHDARPVCFLFQTGFEVCPWGKQPLGLTAQQHPGAKMIRCSATVNNDIERCTPSGNFQRHCGEELARSRTYGETSERCRQRCNDRADCHLAHWHPGNQIWPNNPNSVCFMFPKGTKVCNWNGGELIGSHPWAQMFRCKEPTIVSFSYDIAVQQLMDSTPQVLGRTVMTNICPKGQLHRCPEQTKTLSVSRSTTSSKSWEHAAGVSVTVGTEFSAGVPLLAEGSVSVDVTSSYEHTWGTEETETKEWTVEDECTASAGTRVTCEFFVTKKQVNVPFTIVWSTGQTTRGIYKGVDFFYGGTTSTTEILSYRKR